MKYLKSIVPQILLITFSLLTINASANDEQQVFQQVKRATDKILAIVVDSNQSKSTKSDTIFMIANAMIDFDLMAKLSIGSNGWGKLNSNQKKEYVSLFIKRIRSLYLRTIFAYSKQKIIVEKAEKYKSGRISISTYIQNNNENIELLYKFYLNNKELWRAYDIRIDGVSIVQIERAQYKELLENYTVNDFLKKLKNNNDLRKNGS